MRAFSGRALPVAALLALTTVAAGCSQVGQIQAKRSFRLANQAYAAQDYRTAAELYEETLQLDPNLNYAYFYLGNSYDNQYRPSRAGEPENDALLQKAVENYQTAAERLAAMGGTAPRARRTKRSAWRKP